ncbi:sigma 54-interacting transcriptional regulator [Sorangium sp. So ce448]|uniref:sigma 54-interacting transcriptional regulator n=1 Tax=Sorangium sp. So ce448 TaxID=3133314 RepID=UPI003F626F91
MTNSAGNALDETHFLETWDEQSPVTKQGGRPDALTLYAISPGGSATHRLPSEGAVSLGRGNEARLQIRDPSMSRIHAIVKIGEAVFVEDAGSKNGTSVRGRRLAPGERCQLAIGDSFKAGSTTLVLVDAAAGVGAANRRSSAPRCLEDALPSESLLDESVIIRDGAMKEIYDLARRFAARDTSVLILGETGTGKEILAETIHRHSLRRARPMLRLNCAAFTESLLESELFGYEKGSFSGAVQAKPGLLEAASGGTVFFDEVGEMPLSLQAKLLRVIEDRTVRRVGGVHSRPIDVRFVVATNRDLRQEAERGTFRSDLYYRFNGVSLELPPLRERHSEIEPLMLTFLRRAAKDAGCEPPALSREVREFMHVYPWPGNIRELRNLAERAFVLCGDDGVLTLQHLPVGARSKVDHGTFKVAAEDPLARSQTIPHAGSDTPPAEVPSSFASGAPAERDVIADALQRCAGNQSRAAKMLGISRTTLVSRILQYDLPRPRGGRRGLM